MDELDMTTKNNKKLRPYWHVDLKWIFGILLFFSLGTCLLFFNLSGLTEKDRAVTLSANIVAGLFSKDGLDDEKSITEFREKAAITPGDTVVPVEQFPWLQISKKDALSLGARDLRIAIFRQLTEPIYDKGVAGVAADISKDPAEQEKFVQQAVFLNAFTKSTHSVFQFIFWITAATSVLLLAGLVYFSNGWGRLVSPGIVLLLASPIGTLAGILLLHPPTNGDGPFAQVPQNIAQDIGNSLNNSYSATIILGILLLVAALIGKIVQALLRHRDK
jgi:hypothetical protein